MSNSNEPAYPAAQGDHYQGLTKREVFAMAAMQGLSAVDVTGNYTCAQVAAIAVNQADSLLKELDK